MMVDSLSLVAQAKLDLGEPKTMINLAQRALAITQQIENPWGQVNSALHLSLGLLEIGDYAAALDFAQQAETIARTRNPLVILCITYIVLGNAYRALGELHTARQAHLEAERFNTAMPSHPFKAPVAAALCADCVLSNTWDEAYAWARKYVETRKISLDFHEGLIFWSIIEALLHMGEIERAVEEIQHFGERANDNPRYRIPYLRALAMLDLYSPGSEGEPGIKLAITRLQEALTLAESIGLPGERWPILAKLAELYVLEGHEDQARQASNQAADIVQGLADRIEDERLRAGLLAMKPR
jgi:tetratricopeptide (TPR) repeat protein